MQHNRNARTRRVPNPSEQRSSRNRWFSSVALFIKIAAVITVVMILMIPFFLLYLVYILLLPIIQGDGRNLGLQQPNRPNRRMSLWVFFLRSVLLIGFTIPLFIPLLFLFTLCVMTNTGPAAVGENLLALPGSAAIDPAAVDAPAEDPAVGRAPAMEGVLDQTVDGRDGERQHIDLEVGPQQPPQVAPLSPCILLLLAVILTLTHVIAGAITYIIIGPKNFKGDKTHLLLDALYWSVVTISTTGFGDLTPLTPGGQIATVILVFIGSILNYAAVCLAATAIVRIIERFISRYPSLACLVDHQGRLKISTQVIMLSSFLFLCLLGGTLVGHFTEKFGNLLVSWYFSNMASSSVGYGDMAFKTVFGRIFAIFWLIISPTTYSKAIALLAAQLILRWIRL